MNTVNTDINTKINKMNRHLEKINENLNLG